MIFIDENLQMDLNPNEIDLNYRVFLKKVYTEEEKEAFKDYFFFKKHGYYPGNEPWLTDAVSSLDFSYIEDNEYQEAFKRLCSDFEKSKIKRTFGANVKCYAWYSWVESTQEKYNYTFRTLYVMYNQHHFADKFSLNSQDNRIFDIRDYYIKDKNGKLSKYDDQTCYAMLQYLANNPNLPRGYKKDGITSQEICVEYCKLFRWILYGHNELTFENYLWHVMKFMQMTVKINQCGVTPRDVYDMCRLEWSRTTYRMPSKNSRHNFNKEHCKRYYIEPGYEKETTVNIIKHDLRKQYLALAFKSCRNKNIECNYDNICKEFVLVGGYVKDTSNKKQEKCKKEMDKLISNYHHELDEFMKEYYKYTYEEISHNIETVIAKITRKEMKELIEEMKNQNEFKDLIGDGLVRKTHKPHKPHKPHKEYKKGEERKKSKQQERSLWHSLVKLDMKSKDNYEEIIKQYPNVTRNAYTIYRSRLNKK